MIINYKFKKKILSHFDNKIKKSKLKNFLYLSIFSSIIVHSNAYVSGSLYSHKDLINNNLKKNFINNKDYFIADINWELFEDKTINDEKIIKVANQHKLSMCFSHTRVFKH